MTVQAFLGDDSTTIRRYDRADAPATLRVFRDAVRRGASSFYDDAQRLAWAPVVIDLADWSAQRTRHRTWVAERQGEIVGFTDLTAMGEITMLYVQPEHTRSGIGRALLEDAERCAREADMQHLHVRASLVAEALFKRQGFNVVHRERVEIRRERFAQALMEKRLKPSG